MDLFPSFEHQPQCVFKYKASYVCVCLDACVRARMSEWLHAYTPLPVSLCCVHVRVFAHPCVFGVCMYVCVCMYVDLNNCVCVFVFVCVTAKSLTIVTMKIITAKAAGALTCLTSWKRMRRSCTLRCSWKRDADATRSFIKQNPFFLSESYLAPSLFNNPPLFNEFCYVHRGQRLGPNL